MILPPAAEQVIARLFALDRSGPSGSSKSVTKTDRRALGLGPFNRWNGMIEQEREPSKWNSIRFAPAKALKWAHPPRRLGRRALRWAVNGWLVLHVSAIIIAPASVAPSSTLAQSAWEVVSPYLQLLYLNHGYHFFAPEPAESTLLAFVAQDEEGNILHRGRIPDREIEPRLLYHRHFMLSEHMAGTPPELRELWHRSFADHIGRKYGASQVEPFAADALPADDGDGPRRDSPR